MGCMDITSFTFVIGYFFNKIINYIPRGSTIFFNDTKVIKCRFLFNKSQNIIVEILVINFVILPSVKSHPSYVLWSTYGGDVKQTPAVSPSINFAKSASLVESPHNNR